jgi:hypothetical protein
MRIKHLLAFIGAAAASTMALAAPPSVSDDGNTVYVAGNASPLIRLTQGEAESAIGSFRLEDGRILTLTHHGRRMFMEVDDKREELLATSKTHFVGRHSGAELTVDTLAYPDKVRLIESR